MADLERVQQSTPLTLSQQWYEDGAAVDPGTVTLGITRADGTVLVAAGTSTTGATTNPRTFNLTTTHTALLDYLKVTWTSTAKGTLVSYVEVVGGFLFSLAQARAVPPLSNVTNYPTATLIDMRTTVEQAIEDACGVAFVPRYRRDTISGSGRTVMLQPRVRTIRAASIDGVALTAGQLTALMILPSGIVTWFPYATCDQTVIVDYEYGWSSPPERIRRAALTLTKAWLVEGPVDDRASTFSSVDGGTYGLVVEGRAGSQFGLPTVDAAVNQYSLAVGIA